MEYKKAKHRLTRSMRFRSRWSLHPYLVVVSSSVANFTTTKHRILRNVVRLSLRYAPAHRTTAAIRNIILLNLLANS